MPPQGCAEATALRASAFLSAMAQTTQQPGSTFGLPIAPREDAHCYEQKVRSDRGCLAMLWVPSSARERPPPRAGGGTPRAAAAMSCLGSEAARPLLVNSTDIVSVRGGRKAATATKRGLLDCSGSLVRKGIQLPPISRSRRWTTADCQHRTLPVLQPVSRPRAVLASKSDRGKFTGA